MGLAMGVFFVFFFIPLVTACAIAAAMTAWSGRIPCRKRVLHVPKSLRGIRMIGHLGPQPLMWFQDWLARYP